MHKKIGVIVDAYSTGASLAKRLIKDGFSLIHIQSMNVILEFDAPSFMPENFIVNIKHKNIDSTLDFIRKFSPTFLVAGCESGVILADMLCRELKLPGNDPSSSKMRRDKFLMQMSIKKNGLASIDSIMTNRASDAICFFNKNKLKPVIVKPTNSAGSDGVYCCSSENEIKRAFNTLLGKINSMGEINHNLIVQERIHGDQYIINTVSKSNSHFVVDLWREKRRNLIDHGAIGDKEYLIPKRSYGKKERMIVDYVYQCLSALNIEFGAAHSEVFWCYRRNAPVLIEVGARLQGSICIEAVSRAIGTNQVEELIKLLTDHNRYDGPKLINWNSSQLYMAVLMISNKDTIVGSAINEVRNLPGYVDSYKIPHLNQKIPKTISMDTCPGVVYFSADNIEALESNYHAYRRLERIIFND